MFPCPAVYLRDEKTKPCVMDSKQILTRVVALDHTLGDLPSVVRITGAGERILVAVLPSYRVWRVTFGLCLY